VPGVITGAIVLAAVTSLPNAVAAIFLARRGRAAATLSEALNSNTLNVLAGLLIPAVIITSPGLGGALRIAVWYGILTAATSPWPSPAGESTAAAAPSSSPLTSSSPSPSSPAPSGRLPRSPALSSPEATRRTSPPAEYRFAPAVPGRLPVLREEQASGRSPARHRRGVRCGAGQQEAGTA
jgi:hypothetical protein